MAITKRQVSLLHVAKSKLCLDDEAYRNILQNEGGVTTSTALTPQKFEKVLQYFKRMGFQQSKSTGKRLGYRPGMATPEQVDYIKSLWRTHATKTDDRSLDKWLHHFFGVSSLRFADRAVAGKAIVALKNMTRREQKGRRRNGSARKDTEGS